MPDVPGVARDDLLFRLRTPDVLRHRGIRERAPQQREVLLRPGHELHRHAPMMRQRAAAPPSVVGAVSSVTGAAGSAIVKVLPLPIPALSAQMRPPCATTISREIASPMPAPAMEPVCCA